MRIKISCDSAMRIEINHNFLIELCNALILKVNDVPDAGDNYPICGVGQCIKTRWVNVLKRWVNVSVAIFYGLSRVISLRGLPLR